MPHVIVKLWPGTSEQQKVRLGSSYHKRRGGPFDYGEESVSVAMEEVPSQEWAKQVYQPDIQEKWDKLDKKPGYTM